MNDISVDSLKLRLTDYKIDKDHSLLIQPATFNNGTKELINDFPLFNDQRGSKAFQNYPDGMSINLKPKGNSPMLFVQFSFGRIANNDNYKPVDFEKIQSTFGIVEDRLRETGIHTNILNAELSRIDTFRNVLTDEKPINYFHLLTLCNMKRAVKRDYGSTVNFINSLQEISCYDKLSEMTINKHETRGLPNTLRIEHRLLKASKIKSFLQFHSVNELIQPEYFHHLQSKYLETLSTNIFKFDSTNIELLSQQDIERELIVFQNIYGNRFLTSFIRAKGFENIIQKCDPITFMNAIKNIDKARGQSKERKIRRYKREIDKMKFDLEMIKSDLFAGRSNTELYQELRNKALQAVA